MKNTLSLERVRDLREQATSLVGQNELLLSANSRDRPMLIQELSRIVLGIDPARDIAELGRHDQAELLVVMRSMRDQLASSQ